MIVKPADPTLRDAVGRGNPRQRERSMFGHDIAERSGERAIRGLSTKVIVLARSTIADRFLGVNLLSTYPTVYVDCSR